MSPVTKPFPHLQLPIVAMPSPNRTQSWLTVSGLMLALLLWNWMLALALAIALVSGVTIYLSRERRLTLTWLRQSRAWRHHQSLWLALLSGGTVFSLSYGFMHIWQEADAPWLTTSILVQGISTLSVLCFLIWGKTHNLSQTKPARPSTIEPNITCQNRPFQELLDGLTNANPVARLVAVRQISGRALQPKAPVHRDGVYVWSASDIRHCLLVMKKHEEEPIVREAIDDAIARINSATQKRSPVVSNQHQHQLSSSSTRLTIPNLVRTRATRTNSPQALTDKTYAFHTMSEL